MVGVVKTGAVEAMDGARVREGRPFFLGLPLTLLEEPFLVINDLYNICKVNKHIQQT